MKIVITLLFLISMNSFINTTALLSLKEHSNRKRKNKKLSSTKLKEKASPTKIASTSPIQSLNDKFLDIPEMNEEEIISNFDNKEEFKEIDELLDAYIAIPVSIKQHLTAPKTIANLDDVPEPADEETKTKEKLVIKKIIPKFVILKKKGEFSTASKSIKFSKEPTSKMVSNYEIIKKAKKEKNALDKNLEEPDVPKELKDNIVDKVGSFIIGFKAINPIFDKCTSAALAIKKLIIFLYQENLSDEKKQKLMEKAEEVQNIRINYEKRLLAYKRMEKSESVIKDMKTTGIFESLFSKIKNYAFVAIEEAEKVYEYVKEKFFSLRLVTKLNSFISEVKEYLENSLIGKFVDTIETISSCIKTIASSKALEIGVKVAVLIALPPLGGLIAILTLGYNFAMFAYNFIQFLQSNFEFAESFEYLGKCLAYLLTAALSMIGASKKKK